MALLPAPLIHEPSEANPGTTIVTIIWEHSNGNPYGIEIVHLSETKIIETDSAVYQIKQLKANRLLSVRCFIEPEDDEEETIWSETLSVYTKLPTPQSLSFGDMVSEDKVVLKWNVEVPNINNDDVFKIQLVQTKSEIPIDFEIIGDFTERSGTEEVELVDEANFFWIRLITDVPSINYSRWAESIYYGYITYFQGNNSVGNISNSGSSPIKQIRKTYKGNL